MSSLGEFLDGRPEHLFEAAVDRLQSADRRFRPLLQALAYRRGRGVPSRDNVWVTIAAAFAPEEVREADLGALVAAAAPYVMLDAEAGYSVYRLAHQTFDDLFLKSQTVQGLQDVHRRIADELLHLADATPFDRPLNPYIAKHLSGHVSQAGAGTWWAFARNRTVLDRLDPHAVTAEAFRSLFGQVPLPPEIAGLMGTRHLMRASEPHNRRGLREIGMARFAGVDVPRPPKTSGSTWSLAWAHVVARPTHMTLQGHAGPVEDVAVASGGRVVSAGVDGSVRVWDAATGTQLSTLTGHAGPVRAVAVTSDGRIVSGGDDRTLILWDLITGSVPLRLPGHEGPVQAVTVLADGRIASASADNTVRLWDGDGTVARVFAGHSGPVEAVAAVGESLVSAGVDGTMVVWDGTTGAERHRWSGGAPIRCVAVDTDDRVVFGTADGEVGWWSPTDGDDGTIGVHDGPVETVAVANDGRRRLTITAGADATIRVWDRDGGLQLNQLDGHNRDVLAVVLTPERQIISGGVDSSVRVWDAATSTHLALEGHAGLVHAVALTTNGWVIYGGEEPFMRVVKSSDGARLPPLRGHTGPIRAIAASPNGQIVVSGGDDGIVRTWDVAEARALDSLIGHAGGIRALALTDDGRILSTADDKTIRVWKDGRHLIRLPSPSGSIYALSMQGGSIVCGGEDGDLIVWDADAGTHERRRGHRGPVWALAITPRDQIVSAGEDHTVRVWDDRGDVHTTLHGHTDVVRSVAVTADGRIVSGGDDGTLRLWFPTGAAEWKPVEIPTGAPIRGIAASENLIIAVGSEGVIALLVDLDRMRPHTDD